MNTIKVRITGTRPLLMNSDKLSDPLNPLTKAHKALTSKRKKTDEDSIEIAKSSWLAALYIDEKGPYLPGINIEASVISGGKLSRMGAQLKRAIEVIDEKCHIEYTGPKKAEELWEAGFYDARSVKVQQARLMRYRPIFKKWSTTCEIAFDPEVINKEEVLKCLNDAGSYCGVGDYRPKFGRFEVEVLK